MPHNRLLDHPAVSDHHTTSGSGPTLWEIVWQRKSYIALGVVLGLVLGVLYYSMAARSYETSAQILVLKKRPDRPISASGTANANGPAPVSQTDDFLDTHQTVIRSSVVINNAIAKGSLADLPTFQNSARPGRDLTRALKVSRDRDKSSGHYSSSQILNISFHCSNPDDCAPVLSSVIDSYHDFLNNSTQGSTKEALELIRKARELVQNDLEQKEKDYAEFRRNTPVLWKTQFGTTLHQERLGGIDAQRSALTMRAAQLRATLDAVDAALKQGRPRAELLEIVSALPGQVPVIRGPQGQRSAGGGMTSEGPAGAAQASLEQELIQLQLQEGKLLEDYGPEHPAVKSNRDRTQTIRSLLAPSTTPRAQTAEQRLRDARAKESVVDLKLGQLKQELQEIQRTSESLDTLFKVELQEAKKAFPYETQDDAFRRSIDRSQLLYDNIIKRLQELDLISNFGGFDAQVITPPTEPEKISPRGSLVLPMSLLLGLVLGAGLVYLAELTDKSFRSTEDIRRRLGVPVMGIIPVLKQESKAARKIPVGEVLLDSSLCAWYWPKSKESEAYRGVRTALYFSTRGEGCKVIQITSPNAGDGKSTLAANLAISIAQSGKRVLLVDADLRRPRVDKLFGVANKIGFSSVLEGVSEPPEVIQATAVSGLWVLPCGALPPNPAELLTSPRLAELLAWMRDQYDYVLVDTPPLLAVTDPGVVGPQVDGVILTLRSTKKGRVEAERAREVLHSLGVNIFGVIVNASELGQSSYGYGYYEGGAAYYPENEEESDGGHPRNDRGESAESAPGTNGTSGTNA
jgi:succinoglycan biosynthesis transport protein ExoP